MSITIHIHYTGQGGSAREFAREMVGLGVVSRIRAEEGNLGYDYYLPLEDPETVLLVDSWKDQGALDAHHASPMMGEIAALREKHRLVMRVERFVSDRDGIPAPDEGFIVRERSDNRLWLIPQRHNGSLRSSFFRGNWRH